MLSTKPPSRAVEYTPTDDHRPSRCATGSHRCVMVDDDDDVVVRLARLVDLYADRCAIVELADVLRGGP